MSELTEYLAHKYNNMSKESKSETGLTYNPAYLGGYRQCVVDAQEYKPTLNSNQQIVLDWSVGNDTLIKLIINISDVLKHPYKQPENDEIMEQAFLTLTDEEIIQVFSAWVLEQEEE